MLCGLWLISYCWLRELAAADVSISWPNPGMGIPWDGGRNKKEARLQNSRYLCVALRRDF